MDFPLLITDHCFVCGEGHIKWTLQLRVYFELRKHSKGFWPKLMIVVRKWQNWTKKFFCQVINVY